MAELAHVSLILGSASPRRAALLTTLGVRFDVRSVDLDEEKLIPVDTTDGACAVEIIARAKFAAFVEEATVPLLTADTLVCCGSSLLGKPADDDGQVAMLRQASGSTLLISTAVAVGAVGRQPHVGVTTTSVTLRTIAEDEIERYVATGVGRDKAGALALQGEAGAFIAAVEGCWSNVLGLPLCEVTRLVATHVDSVQVAPCSVERCGSATSGR